MAPDSAEAYHNRALAYTRLGEEARALADYGRALPLDPKLAEAALNRALLHHRAGRRAEALADVRRALTARPGYAAALELERQLQRKPPGPG